MQLILSFQTLLELSNPEPVEEGAPHKKSPADILTSPQLIGFLIQYVKDLKNESGLVI
jgi:hypothetical protein